MRKKLEKLSLEEYLSLKESGHLWEIYPQATGDPRKDLDNANG